MNKNSITMLILSLALAEGIFAIPISAPGALKTGLSRAEAANAGNHSFLWAECSGPATLRGPGCEVVDYFLKRAPRASIAGVPDWTASIGSSSGYGFGLIAGLEEGEAGDSIQAIPQLESVPEPASLALLGLGLMGVFAVSRRKRKS